MENNKLEEIFRAKIQSLERLIENTENPYSCDLYKDELYNFHSSLAESLEEDIDLITFQDLLFFLLYHIVLYFQILLIKQSQKKQNSKQEYNNNNNDMSFMGDGIIEANNFYPNVMKDFVNAFCEMTFEKENDSSEQNINYNLLELAKIIKNVVLDLISCEEFSKDKALKYFHFDFDVYISNRYMKEAKRSYENFILNGKCSQDTFPYVLALFFDFLISNYYQECINKKLLYFIYAIVFIDNNEKLLSLYSDVVMNFAYIENKFFYQYQKDYNIDGEEIKTHESFQTLTPFDYKILIEVLNYIGYIKNKKDFPLIRLYEYSFDFSIAKKIEKYKQVLVINLYNDLNTIFGEQLSVYPGILYSFSKLIKYMSKASIEKIFLKKDISFLKSEYNKLTNVMRMDNISTCVPIERIIDSKIVRYINDKNLQRKADLVFKERSFVLEGIFYCLLYSIFASFINPYNIIIDEKEEIYVKEFYDIINEYQSFLIHRNYSDRKKTREFLKTISVFLFDGKDFFSDLNMDFKDNTSDVIEVVFYLSRFYQDNIHSIVDFLNYVREKQKDILPIVPNLYSTFTLKEAEKYKDKLNQNQKKLQESIDVGFKIEVTHKVSNIQLSKPCVISRSINIKTFIETDKSYEINYIPCRSDYYKFTRKEDYRVTHKNHIENHYLYSDRNIFTHPLNKSMLIESILNENEDLLYSLYDINNFLEKKELELLNATKEEKIGLHYLKLELKNICDKVWNKLFLEPFKNPWIEVFEKDKIKKKYKERLVDVDYTHDLGKEFLIDVNNFLEKIYNIHSEFFLICDVQIMFYLVFQIFSLINIQEISKD
ncbi:MAG: hypothetical protein ACTTKH_02985 [Treponema sp.]